MMGPTHVVTGIVLWAVPASLVLPADQVVVGSLIAGITALGPDIDHPNSILSKALLPIAWIIQKFTTHRVQTHSLASIVLMAIVAAPLSVSAPAFAPAVAVGWASHIASDCLTVQGCALMWPMTRKKYKMPFFRIHTNELGELLYNVVLGVMTVLFAFWRLAA